MQIKNLPNEIQKAINSYGPGRELDNYLAECRRDIEARNSLNFMILSPQDRAFVEFHNQYLQERKK